MQLRCSYHAATTQLPRSYHAATNLDHELERGTGREAVVQEQVGRDGVVERPDDRDYEVRVALRAFGGWGGCVSVVGLLLRAGQGKVVPLGAIGDEVFFCAIGTEMDPRIRRVCVLGVHRRGSSQLLGSF
jgi:hypothetical protein